jgi:signal transduction histidine kinase
MTRSRTAKRARGAEVLAPEVRAVGAALLVVDGGGRVLASTGWEDLFGDPPPDVLPTGGDSGIDLLDAIVSITAEVTRQARSVSRVVPVTLDRHRYYSLLAGPLPEADGHPATAVLALEITDAFRVGPKEGESIRQLGHDLRTPLTSMGGAVELLRKGQLGPLTPEQAKLISMVQQGLDLMLSLIDEATDRYRAAAGSDSESSGPGAEEGAAR